MLQWVLHVQCVQASENAHQGHDIAEHLAQTINPAKGQVPVKKTDDTIDSRVRGHYQEKRQRRHGQQQGAPRPPPQQRDQQCAGQKDQ